MRIRWGVACLAGLTLVLCAPGGVEPAGAGVTPAADSGDLRSGYQGRSCSNTDGGRQFLEFDFDRETVEGENYTGTLQANVPSIGAEGGLSQATLEGSINAKGKVKGSADFGALTLKLEGTLSAEGIAIIGTYTFKQGKKTVDKGQFFLEDDD